MGIYGKQWRLLFNGKFIYKDIRKKIYDYRHGTALKKHIKKRKGYLKETFDSIDWESIEHAGRSLSNGERAWLMKHVGRYNPVGRQLRQQEYWTDSKCPRCGGTNEDSNHVILCPHPTALTTLADSALLLETHLCNLMTHPLIVETIVMTVHDRGHSTFTMNLPVQPTDVPNELYNLIRQAAQAQDRIGFIPLFEGHIATAWKDAQEHAYREIPRCRKTGQTWSKKLISELYKMTRNMWKHRNDTLYNNQHMGTSYKRRKAILRAVKTQLKIGFHCIRPIDRKSIVTDPKTLKKWTTPLLEAWLKNINSIRDRSQKYNLNYQPEATNVHDHLYIERAKMLKRFAIPKFQRWRLKHHHATIAQHLHSTEDLHRQFKKQKLS